MKNILYKMKQKPPKCLIGLIVFLTAMGTKTGVHFLTTIKAIILLT